MTTSATASACSSDAPALIKVLFARALISESSSATVSVKQGGEEEMKRRRRKTGIDLLPMHAAIQMCLPCIVLESLGVEKLGKKKQTKTFKQTECG
jgi:hypothetical protein